MKNHLLTLTLLTNAGFSMLCGAFMCIFHDGIAAFVGSMPAWLFIGVGAGLILFAIDVGWVATRPSINPTLARLICWADILWVVGSIGLLLFAPGMLTTQGTILVGLIAITVAGFAALQLRGLSAGEQPGNPAGSRLTVADN